MQQKVTFQTAKPKSDGKVRRTRTSESAYSATASQTGVAVYLSRPATPLLHFIPTPSGSLS
ncbi:hypothetical protein N7455_001699 [Penicillium solitum]|uniref:uncharacterized protein n=1 Tax=Penicillium solitum TaxID=60172 RepID=UPI0032C42BDD|nr:hypothetical protein N7536_005810 [Penicillium majusculum]KAJ5878234.1 hypothetical protein N7455_001699 [Penicillium solitum]